MWKSHGSMPRSRCPLPGCTRVKRRVVRGLHAVCRRPLPRHLALRVAWGRRRGRKPDGGNLKGRAFENRQFQTLKIKKNTELSVKNLFQPPRVRFFKDELCWIFFSPFFHLRPFGCRKCSFVKNKWKLNTYLRAVML